MQRSGQIEGCPLSERIALFSDGTVNSSTKAQKTNVWRLFQVLDQTTLDQIGKYDDGVGTASNTYLAAGRSAGVSNATSSISTISCAVFTEQATKSTDFGSVVARSRSTFWST